MKIIIEKNDSEEQIIMAKALLANKVINAIETSNSQHQKVQKTDDEITEAIVDITRYFGVSTQWTAVYRVLVDFCGWDNDVVSFSLRINTLLKDVRMSHPCTYQSIQKPLSRSSILRKDFQEWRRYRIPKGDKVFPRQIFIAEKLLKLLSISV